MNLRSMIAKNRSNPLLQLTNMACEKFSRAYGNEFNWDIRTNGEYFLVKALTDVAPGVVFDVGANIGDYAETCLSLEGVAAVHAFEISPPTYAILLARFHGAAKLVLNPFGLGAAAGDVTIYHAPASADRTSLLPINDGYARNTLDAILETGDGYMRLTGLERITLLKIDVEGADLDVLKGFSGSFAAGKVAAVQFEHGEPNVESRVFLKDIVEFLHRYGFQTFRLFPASLERIEACSYAMEDFRGRNYAALLPETAARMGL